MLTAVIKFTNYTHTREQIKLIENIENQAECIELRLDYYNQDNLKSDLATIRNECSLPMIFTLRKSSQGGEYKNNEDQRLAELELLCKLHPNYLDLEYDTCKNFISHIKKSYPTIKIICSYHNFNQTPADLETIFEQINNPQFDYYKIATTANNTIDALRMLQFVQKTNKSHAHNILTGICMGEDGICTRVLGKIVGNTHTYANINPDNITAPGQLTIDELINIYNFKSLDQSSKIYALIGDPITFSVGHILHNKAFRILKKNAVYIKLKITISDLQEFFNYFRLLAFDGCSITMPLKEMVLPFIDTIDSHALAIKSINTAKKNNNQIIGFNTDGVGAISALSKKISLINKKIIILGAGGSARPIAYQAIKEGAIVWILNRDITKANKIAKEFNCNSDSIYNPLKLKTNNYDVLINTLPRNAFADQNLKNILSENIFPKETIILDIIYPERNTPILELAKKYQVDSIQYVFGYEMYINQALHQLKIWFNPSIEQLNKIQTVMHDYFEKPGAVV